MNFFADDHLLTYMKMSDKFLHFMASFLGVMLIDYHWYLSSACIFFIVVGLGFMWEVLNIYVADNFSIRDFVADILGVFSACLVLEGSFYGYILMGLCYLLFEGRRQFKLF